jgi:hypothetical protein
MMLDDIMLAISTMHGKDAAIVIIMGLIELIFLITIISVVFSVVF